MSALSVGTGPERFWGPYISNGIFHYLEEEPFPHDSRNKRFRNLTLNLGSTVVNPALSFTVTQKVDRVKVRTIK